MGLRRYDGYMADLNKLAKSIVDRATDETPVEPESQQVQAGRKGGQTGGRARAEKLSADDRSAIARKAAKVRWA